jgi:hypothetical protein
MAIIRPGDTIPRLPEIGRIRKGGPKRENPKNPEGSKIMGIDLEKHLQEKFYLGKPCKRNKHLYKNTEYCLRYKVNGGCVYCKGVELPGLSDFGPLGASKAEIFWSKVNKSPEINKTCWEWIGQSLVSGYGRMRFDGTYQSSHRISWQMHYGSIPKGLNVLHKCDNRLCVNPEHLFLGTQQDNMIDMVTKGRGNPPRGKFHTFAKLTEEQVIEIYKRAKNGDGLTALARNFNVHMTTVFDIKTQRTWKHLTSKEAI